MSDHDNVFADTAERYWEAGLPVIPLVPGQKRPAIRAWQRFATEMPSAEERQAWLRTFPNGNIGLPLGQASGLIAIDIDTDDPRVFRVLNTVLPETPWVRRGKKGEVRIYRFSGQSSARLKTRDEMICEILSTGTQVVLPPSIHPDTKRPYMANVDLVEVFRIAPEIPLDAVGVIRRMLENEGFEIGQSGGGSRIGKSMSDFVPAGQRDSKMVSLAGFMAREVLLGSRTLLQAMNEVEVWVENFVEHVEGDPLSTDKARKAVLRFLLRDVEGPLKRPLPNGWDEGLTAEDKVNLGIDHWGDEDRIWTASELLEWFVSEITISGAPGSDSHLNAVTKVLSRMARMGDHLQPLDEERLLKVIATHSGRIFTVSTLRKQMRTIAKSEIQGDNHNEVAQAVIVDQEPYGELRFHMGKFWRWDGAMWCEIKDATLQKIVSENFGAFPACKKNSDYREIVRLIGSLRRKDLTQVSFRGINFANGFLTEDLEMEPHNPDFGQTYVLPYRYVPEVAGNMPLFNRFLADCWGKDDDFEAKVSALQEAIGATVFGVASEFQRAFCLYGQPRSGKSVMSQIVRGLLPQETQSSIPPQDWDDTFLPAQLYGKSLNFAGELSETRRIPGDIFKKIVEGEQITVQFKNQNPFEMKPRAAHWFNSNHLPKSGDTSLGFVRRWLFLEFSHQVPEGQENTMLAQDIVQNEREAIMAWAAIGYARLRAKGNYTLPESHHRLAGYMSRSNNSVHDFLSTSVRVKKVKGKEISVTDLYSEYLSFSIAMGVRRRVSASTFSNMLGELQPVFGFELVDREVRMGATQTVVSGLTVG